MRRSPAGDGLGEMMKSTSEAVRTRAVDLAHLARHTMDDRDLEREVLEMFVVQSQVYLIRLKDARTADAWRDAAHTIKGAARGIGAWPVAEMADEVERLSKVDDPEAQRAAIRELDKLVAITNEFIRDFLAGEPR